MAYIYRSSEEQNLIPVLRNDDALLIPNDARRTLDAYERFHTGYPCFDGNNTDRFKSATTFTGNPGDSRDGLWHFSTRP